MDFTKEEINITKQQLDLLEKNGVNFTGDIDKLLLDLDDKITEVGFNADYSLNSLGLELQTLYDELYDQN